MERIVDISYRHKSAHLSSSLTSYPIIDYIYSIKKPGDVVILSAGHGGLAQYVALEKYEQKNAEELFIKYGIHPHRDPDNGIHVSTGSLGCGILVGVGFALADSKKDVHVVISDGECAEGSVWEALFFIQKKNLTNIHIHVNVNGFGAYETINQLQLWIRLKAVWWRTYVWFTKSPNVEFLNGLQAHYHVMNDENKDVLIKYFNEEGVYKNVARCYEKRFKDLLDYCRSWIRRT